MLMSKIEILYRLSSVDNLDFEARKLLSHQIMCAKLLCPICIDAPLADEDQYIKFKNSLQETKE